MVSIPPVGTTSLILYCTPRAYLPTWQSVLAHAQECVLIAWRRCTVHYLTYLTVYRFYRVSQKTWHFTFVHIFANY